MPTRTHWMYKQSIGNPRFDAAARVSLQDVIRRRAAENLPSATYSRVLHRLERLPMSFRKAIPELQVIAQEFNVPMPSLNIKKFRMPKHIRRSKNPIFIWGVS